MLDIHKNNNCDYIHNNASESSYIYHNALKIAEVDSNSGTYRVSRHSQSG